MISITPWKQSDSSLCGPAVVKMVMGYYGVEVDEGEIAKLCGHTFEKGCTDLGMRHAFWAHSFNVNIYNESSLAALERWNKLKIPVIVDWFSPGPPGQVDINEMIHGGHSGIVVDVDNENIHILDPEIARVRVIKRDEFMRVWFDWRDDPAISQTNLIMRQAMIVKPGWYWYGRRY